MKTGILFLALFALVGCAQPEQKSVVRVCDPQGCTDRPRSAVIYETADIGQEDDARIAALEDVAKRDPRAAYDLGLRYFRGDGVRQDSYKALTWMRDAAERGNLNAQKALGRAYLTGLEEMGSDPGEAQRWLSAAASRGDKESAKLLKEANAAKKSEEEYWKLQQEVRVVIYSQWHRGYPYYSTWREDRWTMY